MPFDTFEDIGGGGKSSSSLPRRVSQDVVTNNTRFTMLDFCKTVHLVIVNGRAGLDASIGRCTCKNVSVVDYALVSSDLFSLINEFTVLIFCELYFDVHCPIVLKLNIMIVQKTDLEQFDSPDVILCG